jgi:hypothetical protein
MKMREASIFGPRRWREIATDILNRLTGLPIVSVHYRGHWRIISVAHPMILALIEDSDRGRHARSLVDWWLIEIER